MADLALPIIAEQNLQSQNIDVRTDIPMGKTDEQKKSDAQKVNKIVATWDTLDTRWRTFYTEAVRNFEFLVDEQISPTAKKILKDEGRPELVFNFLLSLVNYISGVIATNKFRMKATPIRIGDEKGAELHTVLVDWAMNGCDGDYEIAKASVMAAIAKIGWLNNYWDASAPGGGKWVTKSYDPMMVRMDPDTKYEDLSDCRYIAVSGFYSAEEIINIFGLDKKDPDKAKKIRDNAKKLEGTGQKDDKPKGWLDKIFNGAADWWSGDKKAYSEYGSLSYVDNYADLRSGIYRVIEFHDRRRYPRTFKYDAETRQTSEIDKETASDKTKMDELKASNPMVFISDETVDELWVTAVCPRLLEDDILLEQPYAVQDRGFQFKPIFWYSYHPDITRTRGILDNVISTQQYFNQRMMTYLEAVMRGVNPDWTMEEGAIAPQDMGGWQSKKHGKMKIYQKSHTKPEREHPMPEVLTSLSNAAEMALDLRKDLTGISPNSLGMMESAKESGVLFNQRVQTGMTMLAHAFGHIQRTMSQSYMYCDRNLQEFLTMPRAVRLLGEPVEGMEGVEMDSTTRDAYWLKINYQTLDGVLNDVTQGEYDFQPDLTQLGATAKQAKFAQTLDVINMLPPEMKMVMIPRWIKYSDLPEAQEMAAEMSAIAKQVMGIDQQNKALNIIGKQHALAGQQVDLQGKNMAMDQASQQPPPDAQGMAQESLKK